MFYVNYGLDLSDANDYCLQMSAAKPAQALSSLSETQRITSEALLGPNKELVILHNGREYRLRLTQNGKLILTA